MDDLPLLSAALYCLGLHKSHLELRLENICDNIRYGDGGAADADSDAMEALRKELSDLDAHQDALLARGYEMSLLLARKIERSGLRRKEKE